MTDLHQKLRAAITARLELARRASHGGDGQWHQTDPDRETGRVEDSNGNAVTYDEGSPTGWQAEHIAANDPADTIRRCEASLRILELHKPTLQNVEWWHDQTGEGKALCCPSCRPANPSEWYPAFGEAGVEPDGFVPSYVVSPCLTLAAMAELAGELEVSRD